VQVDRIHLEFTHRAPFARTLTDDGRRRDDLSVDFDDKSAGMVVSAGSDAG
jgi:hypothetical protein